MSYVTDLDLAQLRALAAVVDEGSFDSAAVVLHLTPSAVSQRIKALEQSAGRVLVRRTKPVEPTEAGQTYLRLARQIAALVHDATAAVDVADQSVVTIPIAVNADSLATWLLPALATLPATICFDLQRDDQARTAELLRSGAVMAAITSVAEPVQGCRSTRLGIMRYRPMASPAFVGRWFAGGVTAESLAVAPIVVFDRSDDLQDEYLRSASEGDLNPHAITCPVRQTSLPPSVSVWAGECCPGSRAWPLRLRVSSSSSIRDVTSMSRCTGNSGR